MALCEGQRKALGESWRRTPGGVQRQHTTARSERQRATQAAIDGPQLSRRQWTARSAAGGKRRRASQPASSDGLTAQGAGGLRDRARRRGLQDSARRRTVRNGARHLAVESGARH
eukprot:5839773-Pleurochrysis_carterae.AAC.1